MQGCVTTLRTVLPSLQYLGLSNNLLWSWEHVHEVAVNLTSLQVLDVSFNRLKFMRRPNELITCVHLRTLVANGCGATWQDVQELGSVFTGLQELYIGSNLINAIGKFDTQSHGFSSLKVLDVTDNKIEGWEALSNLSALAALSCLKLSGNTLNHISLSGMQFILACERMNSFKNPAVFHRIVREYQGRPSLCTDVQVRSYRTSIHCLWLTVEYLTGLL